MKNRFAKPTQMEEVVDFGAEAFLMPIASHKTEITKTDYALTNGSFLFQYFPELFTKDGKLVKRQPQMFIPDEK